MAVACMPSASIAVAPPASTHGPARLSVAPSTLSDVEPGARSDRRLRRAAPAAARGPWAASTAAGRRRRHGSAVSVALSSLAVFVECD